MASSKQYTIKLTSSGNWVANENLDWLSVSPVSGISCTNYPITIDIDNNTTSNTREGVVNFIGGSKTHTVTVSQNGITPVVEEDYLTVSPTSYDFTYEANATTLILSSNTPWLSYEYDPWYSISPTQGEAGRYEITVTAQENTTSNHRTGGIDFCNIDRTISKRVNLRQSFNNETLDSAIGFLLYNINEYGEYVDNLDVPTLNEIPLEPMASSEFELTIPGNVNWLDDIGDESKDLAIYYPSTLVLEGVYVMENNVYSEAICNNAGDISLINGTQFSGIIFSDTAGTNPENPIQIKITFDKILNIQ